MATKFRAHETFFIRKGWLSKGMRYVLQNRMSLPARMIIRWMF